MLVGAMFKMELIIEHVPNVFVRDQIGIDPKSETRENEAYETLSPIIILNVFYFLNYRPSPRQPPLPPAPDRGQHPPGQAFSEFSGNNPPGQVFF